MTNTGGATLGTGGDAAAAAGAAGGTGGDGTVASGGTSATGGAQSGGAQAPGPDAGSTSDSGRVDSAPGTDADAAAGKPTCPAGPFPMPVMQSSKVVCANFPFSYDSNEGPTWVASQNAFFFSNYAIRQATGGDIIKYTPGGDCELFIKGVGCNGLAVTDDGGLLAACQQTRSLVRFDLVTKQSTSVVDRYMGMMLDSPDDLAIHSNGTVYFTNPTFELGARPPGFGLATFRRDPSGALSLIAQGLSNGIALSPDEKKLYVLTSFTQGSAWDLDAQGVPSNRSSLPFGGDGMAVDCAGNLYVSGRIYTSVGQSIGSYVTGGTNLSFGGADRKTVLVVGIGQQVRELQMNVPGLP